MDIVELIYGQLLFVSGKGGVGKSSISAALGRLGAAQGRKTLVVEIDTQSPAMTSIFGLQPRYAAQEVSPNLWVANLDWLNTLEEWVSRTVPAGRIVKMVLANEVVQAFLNVAPGSRETGVLAKLGWLCDDFDLVVVDMPASGHALSLLEAPGMMLSLFPTGPIHEAGRQAKEMMEDAGTHLVLVCLPEEMVINETLETHARVREVIPGLDSDVVVLNRSTPPSLTEEERSLLTHLSSIAADGAVTELLWAGRWEDSLEASTAEATDRLSGEGRSLLFTPRLSQEGGSDQVVQQLAASLARSAKRESNSHE